MTLNIRDKFLAGKTLRLRLMNTGADGWQHFSIDHHTLTVMANDFVPVQPHDTNVMTPGIWSAHRLHCDSGWQCRKVLLDTVHHNLLKSPPA